MSCVGQPREAQVETYKLAAIVLPLPMHPGREGFSLCGSFFLLSLCQPESEGHLLGLFPGTCLKPSLPLLHPVTSSV